VAAPRWANLKSARSCWMLLNLMLYMGCSMSFFIPVWRFGFRILPVRPSPGESVGRLRERNTSEEHIGTIRWDNTLKEYIR
jgi:hypothetical protein